MKPLCDKRRLAQAHRITQFKERRCERERIEAARTEREAARKAEAARKRHAIAQSNSAAARSAFFVEGGREQAEIWMIASQMREEQAANEVQIAEDKADSASTAANQVRREHEALRGRSAHLEDRIGRANGIHAARAEASEDDDTQERFS
ncbi:MAG: hypothetical protein AAF251_08135 [Pseudomonadota bacterium]